MPIIGAPLFIVSNPDLVVEQCKAGVVGSFPALNARGSDSALDDWMCDIKARLDDSEHPAPFACNQIVHRSNDRLMKDMETIVKHEVPIVITSLGAREDINDAVHSYGGVVFHDVVNDFFAKKAVSKGADGLVAEEVDGAGEGAVDEVVGPVGHHQGAAAAHVREGVLDRDSVADDLIVGGEAGVDVIPEPARPRREEDRAVVDQLLVALGGEQPLDRELRRRDPARAALPLGLAARAGVQGHSLLRQLLTRARGHLLGEWLEER